MRGALAPWRGADHSAGGGRDDGLMVEIGHWLVFPRAGTTGGNPCPLVADAGRLAPSQMLAIAAHYGHESGFVTRTGESGADLRFFVPRHEMRMCVHATVAAVTALISAGILGGRQATVRTASGEHTVSWGTGEPPEVTVEQNPPSPGPAAAVHHEVAAALRLPAESMVTTSPVQPVSVSRAKLIVPVRDADAVHRARPDFPALWALCQRLTAPAPTSSHRMLTGIPRIWSRGSSRSTRATPKIRPPVSLPPRSPPT